ncbi:Phosphogluconate dehydratase [Geodia barretti]|uniref:Phosphogluconate dehydratase n=1 Tax=Geodia barretti TaxID=519541 RepID=A0AA35TZK2_GEOBA|nr:Phosphogluconate dehydratase [Geodia barretti]
MVGLHATGGSTNLTLHLVAMARAAGVLIDWSDMAELSAVTPLMARVYPNGLADVNHFHAAGGLGFMIGELLEAGLLHGDVRTVAGDGLARYTLEPVLGDDGLAWREGARTSLNDRILRPAADPFQRTGGLAVLTGNLGQAVIKTSADQEEIKAAFRNGELERDFICVLRFQGPQANGMPELHSLTPVLSVLQDRGFRVALLTDGRMSGASGKVPAAIHVTPEAAAGGAIARVRDGDMLRLDAAAGRLDVLGDPAEFAGRAPAQADLSANACGIGRELFAAFRRNVGPAETGAAVVV